jgi:D-glycerate 3-kinase
VTHTRFLPDLYVPVIDWLLREIKAHAGATYLLGIHGAQGTGKTTLADILSRHLCDKNECSVVCISIDDFYLTRQERQKLAASVHPLLATRGPPGTHDIDLALETNRKIRSLSADESMAIPRFDKAIDDRVPESQWPTVNGPVDLVILEGWCVGSKPVEPDSLLEPINALERTEDEHGTWRRFVNDSLLSYQPLFDLIDGLLMLRPPNFDTIFEWRLKQEKELQQSSPEDSDCIMSENELSRFIQLFERITLASDATVGAKADVVVQLGIDHQPVSVDIRPEARHFPTCQ